MQTTLHRPRMALACCSCAILVLSLLVPVAASAEAVGQTEPGAQRESREAQRASRAEERLSRAQERRTTREQERAARKATRAQERETRRGAQRGAKRQAATEPVPGANETPATPTPSATNTADDEAALGKCRATIESSAAQTTAGETVTLFGKLSCPAGTSAAERQLTVYQGQRGVPAASFTVLGSATTEADGSYELTSLAFETNTIFRVRVGNHGARVLVRVAPVVTLEGPSPAAKLSTVGGSGAHALGTHPAKVSFSGTVSPVADGARVSLQVAYAAGGEAWRTVAFGSVGSDGSYSVAHGFRAAGQASVRVLVHMRHEQLVAASEPLTYEIAQAQNPKLTIFSSQAPVADGQAVTISGVAAEAAAQTVTLLARTRSGVFAAAATTTTDPSGNYSFTQVPAQSGYYRVTLGKTRSTTLVEGVERALAPDPAPSTVAAGQQLTLTGAVTPAADGQLVYAERQNASGVGFHVVANGTVAGGRYSISHTFANAGSYVLRIRVPGDSAYQATTSSPFDFEVTPAPASGLAPEAPADATPAA